MNSSINLSEFVLDDPPTDYLAAIGLVSARYSKVELSLVSLMQRMSGMAIDRCHAVTAHMVTPTRLDAFLALAKLEFASEPAMIHEAELLAESFESIAAERANIIHPIWISDAKSGAVIRARITARSELKQLFEQHSVEEIRRTADRISALALRLVKFNLAGFDWENIPAGMPPGRHALVVTGCRAEINERYAKFLEAAEEAAKNKARKKAHAEASRLNPGNKPAGS